MSDQEVLDSLEHTARVHDAALSEAQPDEYLGLLGNDLLTLVFNVQRALSGFPSDNVVALLFLVRLVARPNGD